MRFYGSRSPTRSRKLMGNLSIQEASFRQSRRAAPSYHVIGLDRYGEKDDPPSTAHNIRWQLHRWRPNPAWRRLVSPLPNLALLCASSAGRRALGRALEHEFWDAVVFDSMMSGWALNSVLRQRHRFRRLVYIAHNCETTAAWRVANAARGLRRLTKRLDAAKTAMLERRLLGEADLVSSTPLMIAMH